MFYFIKIAFILVMPVEVYIFITDISQFFASKPAYYNTSRDKQTLKRPGQA